MSSTSEIENIVKPEANADTSQDLKQHVSERVKFYEDNTKGSASPTHLKSQTKSNNFQFLVPIGILIAALFTLYLASAAFQSSSVNYKQQKAQKNEDENNALKEKENQQAQEAVEPIKMLEKLLEYKDLCTELEIFTKDLRLLNKLIKKNDYSKDSVLEMVDVAEDVGYSGDEQIDANTQNDNRASPINNRAHRNVQRRLNKRTSLKNKKVTNEDTKNFSDSSNNNKKDQTTTKKSNTAEPIIYLFALVFIYLLLKAASDINQHYKSQNKGDKRLRRCSLQSYAQTHKQDRRASKGSPKQNHNKELLMKIRSKSVDRTNEAIAKKSKILASLRKYISLDDQNRLANMPYGIHGLVQSPIQCKPNNNEEIALNNLGFGTNLSSRRCSVPVTLNFQRHKINTVPVVSASNMSKRRSSLIGHHIAMEPHMSGIQFPDPAPEGQFYEVKRRVRMINRH